MASSVFYDVDNAPPIEVFLLNKLFNECRNPARVNLGIGAYRDDDGKAWVLPVVKTAELLIANDKTLNHEYLPISGLPSFRTAATQLLFGSGHRVLLENKAEGFQTPGGTGALRLGAAFLRNVLKFSTVYLSHPTWENHRGVCKSAGFLIIKEYRYLHNETRDLNFAGLCEDLLNAAPYSVVIMQAIAHNPTGIDPSKEQWIEICKICKEKNMFVMMDIAYQGFTSGDLENDAWVPRYFADQDMDFFVAQSFSKNFGLYNERVGNLIVISKDENKLADIRSQMEVLIRTLWSNPPNHGARIVATVLNNYDLFEKWKFQLSIMANRTKKMRHELLDYLKKLGTPGNWDHITKQIGMYSYSGLTEKQVRYMKEKSVFLLSCGRISIAGVTIKNVGYVAKTIDEAVRAYPVLQLSDTAGEPIIGTSKKYFLEFAKQKLSQVGFNVIKSPVVIDGIILKEEEEAEPEEVESVQSFVKFKLIGSFSSTSSSEWKMSPESEQDLQFLKDVTEQANEEDQALDLALSTNSLPGTGRLTVKTYKTQSIQTLKTTEMENLYQPKAMPARFEGTMLTPVYFDGLMLTSERLDALLADASKKDDNAIPVKFQGGMLTAAFKTLAENLELGHGTEPVNVKFQGRLKALSNNEVNIGIPVAFDGAMIPQTKNTKAKR